MLLANRLVGTTLVQKCRELALLRKHPVPKKNLRDANEFVEEMGLNLKQKFNDK